MVANKVIDNPLNWKQVKDAFSRTAPLVKQAYDLSGKKPPESDFMRTDASDLRGVPVWQMEKWKEYT